VLQLKHAIVLVFLLSLLSPIDIGDRLRLSLIIGRWVRFTLT